MESSVARTTISLFTLIIITIDSVWFSPSSPPPPPIPPSPPEEEPKPQVKSVPVPPTEARAEKAASRPQASTRHGQMPRVKCEGRCAKLFEGIRQFSQSQPKRAPFSGELTWPAKSESWKRPLVQGNILKAIGGKRLLLGKREAPGKPQLIRTEIIDGIEQSVFLFTDPVVGSFEVFVFRGAKESRKGDVIVGVHGHFETPEAFFQNRGGPLLVRQGYIVVIPSTYLEFPPEEAIASRDVAEVGVLMMAFLLRQGQLVLRHVKGSAEMKHRKRFLQCHSGGCATAWILAWFDSTISGVAYDHRSSFSPTKGGEHCESIVPLVDVAGEIQKGSLSNTPSHKFTYYKKKIPSNEAAQLLGFFKREGMKTPAIP